MIPEFWCLVSKIVLDSQWEKVFVVIKKNLEIIITIYFNIERSEQFLKPYSFSACYEIFTNLLHWNELDQIIEQVRK